MKQKFFCRIAFRHLGLHRVAFRAASVLLLVITAASAMEATGMALPAKPFSGRLSTVLSSQPAPPAGCHSPELPASLPLPVVPATIPPAPRSYQCCVTGHHIAIPFASFSHRLVFSCVGDASGAGQFSLLTAARSSSSVLISPFGSPPGSVSLRI